MPLPLTATRALALEVALSANSGLETHNRIAVPVVK